MLKIWILILIFTFNIINQICHKILHLDLHVTLLKWFSFICNGCWNSQPAKLLYTMSRWYFNYVMQILIFKQRKLLVDIYANLHIDGCQIKWFKCFALGNANCGGGFIKGNYNGNLCIILYCVLPSGRYDKCAKISNKNKMLIFKIGNCKIIVKIAKRKDPDQTASSEADWFGSALLV